MNKQSIFLCWVVEELKEKLEQKLTSNDVIKPFIKTTNPESRSSQDNKSDLIHSCPSQPLFPLFPVMCECCQQGTVVQSHTMMDLWECFGDKLHKPFQLRLIRLTSTNPNKVAALPWIGRTKVLWPQQESTMDYGTNHFPINSLPGLGYTQQNSFHSCYSWFKIHIKWWYDMVHGWSSLEFWILNKLSFKQLW